VTHEVSAPTLDAFGIGVFQRNLERGRLQFAVVDERLKARDGIIGVEVLAFSQLAFQANRRHFREARGSFLARLQIQILHIQLKNLKCYQCCKQVKLKS